MRLGTRRFGIGPVSGPRTQPARGLAGLFRRAPGPPSRADVRWAWMVAIAADGFQIVLMPLFVAGGLSVADDLLDLAVGVLMIRLLGWHPAFLPTFLAELIPGLDLFPTWIASVWFATRGLARRPDEGSSG